MSQAVENKEKRLELIEFKRKFLKEKYPRDNEIHLSDCTTFIYSCSMKPYFRLTMDNPPPPKETGIVAMYSGQIYEDSLALIQPGEYKTANGIHCSIDGRWKDGSMVEVKTTGENHKYFNPLTSHPDWTARNKGYCHAWGEDKLNLIVLFNKILAIFFARDLYNTFGFKGFSFFSIHFCLLSFLFYDFKFMSFYFDVIIIH